MSETDGLEVVAENRKRVKHAVLVIHGMGEQHPMSTLRGFVKSIWERNKDIVSTRKKVEDPRRVWTKPDRIANSFEQQRITTRRARGRKGEDVRVDFYEYYWAHRTTGTTWTHLKDWIFTLLLKNPQTIPSDVKHVWVLLWILNFVAVFFLLLFLGQLFEFIRLRNESVQPGILRDEGIVALSFLAVAVLAAGILSFLARYFGDVARYVRPAPDNIRIRHEIRETGVNFLRRLNDAKLPGGGNRYERVIVVGHSLGSVIAYDLLIHLWAERALEMGMSESGTTASALGTIRLMERKIDELKQVEDEIDRLQLEGVRFGSSFGFLSRIKSWIGLEPVAADDVDVEKKRSENLLGLMSMIKTWIGLEPSIAGDTAVDEELARKLVEKERLRKDYHHLQRSLAEKLRSFRSPWRISDFISIGSPLTHAEFLMARRREIFDQRIAERSLSSCPPFLETYEVGGDRGSKDPERRFSYKTRRNPYKLPQWFMHHAAVFAPVRWTNVYDDDFMVFYGDIFSGAVASLFGSAVEDVSVTVHSEQLCSRFFTHTSYWTWDHGEDDDDPPAHVRTLQRVLFEDVFLDRATSRS